MECSWPPLWWEGNKQQTCLLPANQYMYIRCDIVHRCRPRWQANAELLKFFFFFCWYLRQAQKWQVLICIYLFLSTCWFSQFYKKVIWAISTKSGGQVARKRMWYFLGRIWFVGWSQKFLIWIHENDTIPQSKNSPITHQKGANCHVCQFEPMFWVIHSTQKGWILWLIHLSRHLHELNE